MSEEIPAIVNAVFGGSVIGFIVGFALSLRRNS